MKRRGGLPSREHSVLLQYRPTSILDMEPCEFNMLLNWGRTIHKRILKKLNADPELRIGFKLSEDSVYCPGLSAEGKRIQELIFDFPQPLSRGKGEGITGRFSYAHQFRGRYVYWIPENFLP